MPRFVLLYHECPPHYARQSHWDLMLEAGDTLRTWAVAHLPHEWRDARDRTSRMYPDCPVASGDNSVRVEELANHRLDYLEKQGPISGNRGQVSRIDGGTYAADVASTALLRLTLTGITWSGEVTLRQLTPDSSEWTLAVRPLQG